MEVVSCGKISGVTNWKVYWACTCTTLPGLVSGVHVVFTTRFCLATFRRKKEKLRGGWVQSANFASECARKLLIL